MERILCHLYIKLYTFSMTPLVFKITVVNVMLRSEVGCWSAQSHCPVMKELILLSLLTYEQSYDSQLVAIFFLFKLRTQKLSMDGRVGPFPLITMCANVGIYYLMQ